MGYTVKTRYSLTRSLGPGNFDCYYQAFCYISNKKLKQNKTTDSTGTERNCLLYQAFCYISTKKKQ